MTGRLIRVISTCILLLAAGAVVNATQLPPQVAAVTSPARQAGRPILPQRTPAGGTWPGGTPRLFPALDPTHPLGSYPARAPLAPVRGLAGDFWADTIIGKPRFSEVSPWTTVPNKLFWVHGVIVDRSTAGNKLYIYDSGNNRILGLHLANCLARPGNPLNCVADLVIGQPDAYHSGCNGDSGFQNYPTRAPAGATSLCGQQESQLSISEGGSGASMDVDAQGNLYVPDFFNHRVLKYNSPFTTDGVADEVWGQVDFTANSCNQGLPQPSASTFCFTWGHSNNWTIGVDLDPQGNLWVVDSGNNRVLRFPPGAHTADLVLGQPSFTTHGPGSGLNQFRDPAAVRMNSRGWIYVADHGNDRVMVFEPPFSNNMNGRRFGPTLPPNPNPEPFWQPSGVDFDPTRPGVWIANQQHGTVERWDEDTQVLVQTLGRRNDENVIGDASGSIGIDAAGNVYVPVAEGEYKNDILQYAPGGSSTLPTRQLFGDALGRGSYGGNLITGSSLASGAGVVVNNGQLIVADNGRLLFWNNALSLANGQQADGFGGGVADFTSRLEGCCLSLQADRSQHLWVSVGQNGPLHDRITAYNLPLTSGAAPIRTLRFPLPVLGGGQISYSNPDYQPFWGLAPTPDSSYLWVSHADTSRVFRIRDPLTNPVVDVILGQTSLAGTACNRGAPPVSGATPYTLCWPGSLALDRSGNLYVSDHSLEARGNIRLLEFNAGLFPPNNPTVIFAPAASKIFPSIATWQPAFDSGNRMVVGYNPYWSINPNGGWFPGIYNDPLATSTTPDTLLYDYYSMAFAATFDEYDNLYIGDLDRSRVLIYQRPVSPRCLGQALADVCPGDWYYPFVTYLVGLGAISGYNCGGPGEPCYPPSNAPWFRPNNTITRAQMVKVVVLAYNLPPGPQAQLFADIPPSHPFYSYINAAAHQGIISGYDCGGPGEPCGPGNLPYFRPYNAIIRGQASKVIVLARGWSLISPLSPTFADVPRTHPFYTYIETAYAAAILSGYSCGGPGELCDPQNRPYFRPYNNITRAQAAKMIALGGNPQLPSPTPTASPTRAASPTPTCGPAWHVVANADPGTGMQDQLWDVAAVSNNNVWAVGEYRDGNGVQRTLIEHWDGAVWSVTPNTSQPGVLYGLAALGPNDIWAVGSGNAQTLTMHWDGAQWSVVPSPNGGAAWNKLAGVSLRAANDAWAVGADGNGFTARTLALHWDGSLWSIVASPDPAGGYNEFYGVATVGATDAWAVGYYNDNNNKYTLIARWDGGTWSVVPSPNPLGGYNEFWSIAAVTPNDIWTVGSSIARWNGTAWVDVPWPNAGALRSIDFIAANDIWAVGSSNGTLNRTLTQHWDGSAWSTVPSPNAGADDNSFAGVAAVSALDIWAVGSNGPNNARLPLTEHYLLACTALKAPGQVR